MNLSGLALACKCTIRYYPVQMRYLGIPLAEKMIHRSTLIRSNVVPHLPIPASISQNSITLGMYGITETHLSCFHFYRVPCAAYMEPSSKFVYLKWGLSRWLIRSGCGSKLRGTVFESRPGRIFFIGVVHIQCSKLFKGLECAVLSMVYYK